MSPPKKILIMGREHIGDVVNATGAIRSIRKLFPDAFICVEVGERATDLLANLPIDEVWSRPTHQGLLGKLLFIRKARSSGFDLAIILDDSNSMILHVWLASIRNRVGIFKNKHRSLFTQCVDFDPGEHDVFHGLEGILKLLGVPDLNLEPDLGVSRKTTQTGRIAFNPGASLRQKEWPAQNWQRLAQLIGPNRVTELAPPGSPAILNLASVEITSKNLLSFASELTMFDLLVTSDSGPAHIAAAVGVPCAVLYGPTDPTRFAPYGEHLLLREDKGCDLYRGVCAAGTCDHSCMSALSPEQVFSSLKARFGRILDS